MIHYSECLKIIMERQGNICYSQKVGHPHISTSIMFNMLWSLLSLSCFMYKHEVRMRCFVILVFTTNVFFVKSNQKPLAEALYT